MFIMQIFACGVAAVMLLPLSLSLAWEKKHGSGSFWAIMGFFAAILTAIVWREMLYQSGKTDWYLLGIHNYPFAAAICIIMLLTGVLCIGINLRALMKRKAGSGGGISP